MPSLRDVKRRIVSIRNTSKVTHALEAVSATKMRRWQEKALHARPFAIKALELLASLKQKSSPAYAAIAKSVNDQAPIVMIVVSSDKGLCGGYNIRLLTKVMADSLTLDKEVQYVALGRYGRDYLRRRDKNILLEEVGFGEKITRDRITEMYEFLEKGFLEGVFSRVLVAYTEFVSTLKQEPKVRQFLPINEHELRAIVESITPRYGKYANEASEAAASPASFAYVFEPSAKTIIPTLMKELTQVALFHMVLEANASEHSARMVAMKNATDNAKELLKILNLQYNKARQGEITKGVLEVAAGAEALSS